jgi:phosphoribosylformylglycinamidine synthase PurS subunit
MKAVVHVTLKPEVLDPQGKAIQRASASLGYAAVRAVRQGKVFEIELDAAALDDDPQRARALLEELCEKLLANPVIEDYRILALDS